MLIVVFHINNANIANIGGIMNQGTETQAFGTTKRENHDSTKFYSSRMYEGVKIPPKRKSDLIEVQLPEKQKNQTHCADSRDLSLIPDSSLHLVVTSPPYNAKKVYDEDLTLHEYIQLLYDVFGEVYDKLVDGGRVCINIANVGRKPYIPLSDYVSKMMTDIGYYQRGEIIWDKASSAGSSTAWGSWKSASNPTLRDVHEYILVFSKGTMNRQRGEKENTITRDEFLEFTKSVWSFPTASAKRLKHPAPYPVELPYRCIQLYSYKDDMVFDPFMGSGSTAIAALKAGRNFMGYDNSEEYAELANERVELWKLSQEHPSSLK